VALAFLILEGESSASDEVTSRLELEEDTAEGDVDLSMLMAES
jgi:hypothetical protein